VRSFFKKNRVELKFDRGELALPTVQKKDYVPTAEDVKLMLEVARCARDRFIVLAMFQSGFDQSTLASLNYGDVSYSLERNERPIQVHKVRHKTRRRAIAQKTFLGFEACDALTVYLEERKRRGEVFTADTPLLLDRSGKRLGEKRIGALLKELGEVIKTPTGYQFHGHCLRKAFKRALRRVKIDPEWRDLMAGHVLPRGGAYVTPTWEDLREVYLEAYEKSLKIYGVANAKVGVGMMTNQMEALIGILLPALLKSPNIRNELKKLLEEKAEFEYDPLKEPKPIMLILQEKLRELI